MSRPPKGRHPALADRLARSLDGQLADTASTMGALDLDAGPNRAAPPAAAGDTGATSTSAEAEAAAAGDPGGPPQAPPALDSVLDAFEDAMGAMLDDRARVLAQRRADDDPRPADEGP